MTNKDEFTIEERVIAVSQPSMLDDGDDEFQDDEDATGLKGSPDAAEGELTPNDIFGLDPLDVLTLEELAEYLKVSAAAAHRVIKEQKLPGRNIGGEWRFLRDAVANWLRCQEAPVQQQQKAREDYSKAKAAPAPAPEPEAERFSRPPQRPAYQPEPSGGEYRPRQRFPEGGQQYGNQGGGQYGNRGGQGGGQYGGGQYGGSQSAGGGQYRSGGYSGGGGTGGAGGGYSPPPRRPFRAAEGGQGGYGTGAEGGSGYGGAGGGARFGGGGYQAGGQRFSEGPKRKNKRQVFDNERGKRLDRRKEGETSEGEE